MTGLTADKAFLAVVWTQAENIGSWLYAVRSGRPTTDARLAGARLPVYRRSCSQSIPTYSRETGISQERWRIFYLIDIKQAIDFLTSHPRKAGPSSAQASSYNHL